MVQRLWPLCAGRPQDEPLFVSGRGGRLHESNARGRVLEPARERAGLPWVTFHSFRHTCASLLFDVGKNVKQVSEWLGHADPAFTLRTYVHLMDDGLGAADFLDGAIISAQGAAQRKGGGGGGRRSAAGISSVGPILNRAVSIGPE